MIDLLRSAGNRQCRCVMLMWSGGLKVLEVKLVGTLGEAQASLLSAVADLTPTLEEWSEGNWVYLSSISLECMKNTMWLWLLALKPSDYGERTTTTTTQ